MNRSERVTAQAETHPNGARASGGQAASRAPWRSPKAAPAEEDATGFGDGLVVGGSGRVAMEPVQHCLLVEWRDLLVVGGIVPGPRNDEHIGVWACALPGGDAFLDWDPFVLVAVDEQD